MHFPEVVDNQSMFHRIDFCRRFAHLLAKKDVCSPEVKKELLKKVKSAISATAERFSGYMQNVSIIAFRNNCVCCSLFGLHCQASSLFDSDLSF